MPLTAELPKVDKEAETMFRFLTKNRKGFTIVELMVVLLLLSLGVLALANMFRVTYRAFQKSEERSIKQETVKIVAEMLRAGQTNVASAMSADIFDTTDVIPTKEADITYSYLYFEPHKACSTCGEDWDSEEDVCTASCGGTTGEVDGYFLKCMNKGATKDQATQLSDIPIYVEFQPITDENPGDDFESNQCGVVITLAALEDDFVYESTQTNDDGEEEIVLNTPISDDIYYSLDVAYHFPNMVFSESGATVNFQKEGERSRATLYGADGSLQTEIQEGANKATVKTVPSVDDNGVVLRVYSDSILSGDSSNSNLSTPTMCFIATASYGHDSGEVGLLCKFRDECLLTNPLGTAFVNAYYKLSPPIAEFIAESEPLKAAVRAALKPLVGIATNALDEDVASQNAGWFVMFMLCGAGATATLIKINKRKKKVNK